MSSDLSFDAKVKLAGYYRMVVRDCAGTVTKDSGWFHNLITNQGLDFMGLVPAVGQSGYTNAFAAYCSVGTGNTAPTYADTQLTSYVASHVFTGTFSTAYVAGPPAYWSTVSTYNFPVGAATGNLAEVGTGIMGSSLTQPSLFSHALIVDGSGSPTTITVLSTESLSVYFELRCYLDLTDHPYSCTISGVTYSGIWRMYGVTSAPSIWQGYQYGVAGSNYSIPGTGPSTYWYNGTISSVTGTGPTGSFGPTGTSYSIANTPYTNGNLFFTVTETVPLGECNFGGLTAGSTSIYCIQFRFQWSISPAIPKTSSYTMSQSFSFSWSRY